MTGVSGRESIIGTQYSDVSAGIFRPGADACAETGAEAAPAGIVASTFSTRSGIVRSCSAEKPTPGLTRAARTASGTNPSMPQRSQRFAASLTTDSDSREKTSPFIGYGERVHSCIRISHHSTR